MPPARPTASAPTADPSASFGLDDLGAGNSLGSTPYRPPAQRFGAGQPYAPPTSYGGPGQYRAPAGTRPPALYIIPGALILVWSVLLVGGSIYRLVDMGIVLATRDNIPAAAIPWIIGFVVGALLAGVVAVVMLIGSVNMLRRTGLSTARTAAILAIVPCFGGCVFPIGIWATILLFTGSVKKDFTG